MATKAAAGAKLGRTLPAEPGLSGAKATLGGESAELSEPHERIQSLCTTVNLVNRAGGE